MSKAVNHTYGDYWNETRTRWYGSSGNESRKLSLNNNRPQKPLERNILWSTSIWTTRLGQKALAKLLKLSGSHDSTTLKNSNYVWYNMVNSEIFETNFDASI